MSFQTFVKERLADLTAKYNAIATNAKKIDELPVQSNLDPASKIHVSRGENSESLTVQKIIDAVSSGSYDKLLAIGEIELVGNVATIPANAQWKIGDTYYGNNAAIERTIPYCATGFSRKDILVANTSNDIVLVQGPETAGEIVIAPNIPINTVFITEMDVTDSTVGTPITPVITDDFVLKRESQDYLINYFDAVIEEVYLSDERASLSFTGSNTDVKSIRLSEEFMRLGKLFTFKNRQTIPVTFWHNSGTGNVKLLFPTEENFVLKPNEIIQFSLNLNDSSTPKLEYIGVSGGVELPIAITDVTGLTAELHDKASATYVDSQDTAKLVEAKAYSDGLITQLIDGAPADANTLKELNDKILAVQAIIGGTTADGDALVNTVNELLQVFATFPEGVDLVTLLAGKVNTTDVYNALDCIVAGKVADARQLKVLNDLIVALTTVVAGKEDTSNKSNDIEADKTSTTKYSSVKQLYDWAVAKFQAVLVSGTNIKTINGTSILGSGDIAISGGGGGDMTTTTDQTVSGIKTFLSGKIGFRNGANTFTSFFTNANTASRNYTLQNRDGTLLDNTDLSTINTSISTKMANPTGGIVNYLPKFLTGITMGISRLFDDGTFFGLGTANAPTKDFTLGNQANRKIGVEASNSTTAGRDLDTEAGMTVNYALSSEFIATNIGVNGIRDMCVGMNNDVYLAYYGSVLKQTGGSGAFTTVYTGALQVHGIAVHKTTGTVLIAINGGGILKQTNGTGSFVDTGETVRNYRCIRIHQNGNIYATTDVGCFMQTSGTGAYSLVSSVTFLYGLAIDPISGDVYFNSGNSVSLYLQTAGSGTFNLVGNNLSDRQMCFDNLGNFYVFLNNYLYKRTAGSSVYNKITTITGALFAVGVLDNGNVYTADYYLNNIYIQNNVATGTPNLDGGTRRDKAGTGKGTGKSWYEIWTGQKTTSGTDMQVSTIRLRVDETGNIILFTDKIFANNADALAGGLPLKTIYWTTTGEMRIVV